MQVVPPSPEEKAHRLCVLWPSIKRVHPRSGRRTSVPLVGARARETYEEEEEEEENVHRGTYIERKREREGKTCTIAREIRQYFQEICVRVFVAHACVRARSV